MLAVVRLKVTDRYGRHGDGLGTRHVVEMPYGDLPEIRGEGGWDGHHRLWVVGSLRFHSLGFDGALGPVLINRRPPFFSPVCSGPGRGEGANK